MDWSVVGVKELSGCGDEMRYPASKAMLTLLGSDY